MLPSNIMLDGLTANQNGKTPEVKICKMSRMRAQSKIICG